MDETQRSFKSLKVHQDHLKELIIRDPSQGTMTPFMALSECGNVAFLSQLDLRILIMLYLMNFGFWLCMIS